MHACNPASSDTVYIGEFSSLCGISNAYYSAKIICQTSLLFNQSIDHIEFDKCNKLLSTPILMLGDGKVIITVIHPTQVHVIKELTIHEKIVFRE